MGRRQSFSNHNRHVGTKYFLARPRVDALSSFSLARVVPQECACGECANRRLLVPLALCPCTRMSPLLLWVPVTPKRRSAGLGRLGTRVGADLGWTARPATAADAPSAASVSAIARPNPRLASVTIAARCQGARSPAGPYIRTTPCTTMAVVWSTQASSSCSSGRSSSRSIVAPPINSINRSGSTSG